MEGWQNKKELQEAVQDLFNSGRIEELNPDMPAEEQAQLLPYDPKWECSRADIKLGEILIQC